MISIVFFAAALAYKVGKQMLSLAEGMPNENVFPFTKLSLESQSGAVLEMEGKELAAALQYVPSMGSVFYMYFIFN